MACSKMRNVSGHRRYGFTLIEIILVIALITVVSGIAMYQMKPPNMDEKPLDQWVWEAIFHARLQALETKEKAVLVYDEEARSLHVKAFEIVVQTFVVPPNHTGEIKVEFYPLLSDEGTGSFTIEYADDPIEELLFYPSGASVPMRINVENTGGENLVLTPDYFASYYQTPKDD